MENSKDQLIERIKSANNVLVTVSSNPSVDQLSAAIGLTLTLNKMGKHATAVYSGSTPSTIEFLKPEKTIEKNTDSLRDFIIALDKSKADKLRYKVEENHVKIFITPYRTSISDKDLEFSQGDFNVDVVVALGVTDQKDLDQAITAHGRILHDATTISVTTGQQSNLGTINWVDGAASSLCEMMVGVTETLQSDVLDAQIATAFMTGIVAETDRFSNDKTSSSAMSASAKLMAAGANQQLVASELQEKPAETEAPEEEVISVDEPTQDDSSFQIAHEAESAEQQATEEPWKEPEWQSYEPIATELPEVQSELPESEPAEESLDEQPETEIPQEEPSSEEHEQPLLLPEETTELPEEVSEEVQELPQEEPEVSEPETLPEIETKPLPEMAVEEPTPTYEQGAASTMQGGNSFVSEPPERGGKLTANTEPESLDPALDPLAGSYDSPILNHQSSTDGGDSTDAQEIPAPTMTLPSEVGMSEPQPMPDPAAPTFPQPMPSPFGPLPPAPAVPDAASETPVTPEEPQGDPNLDSARDAVAAAMASANNQPLPPIEALNAAPLDLEIKQTGETGVLDHTEPEQPTESGFSMPENLVPPAEGLPEDTTATDINNPMAPPPVPPPLMPPTFSNGMMPPMPGQASAEPAAPTDNNAQSSPNNPFNLPPA